jgi:hypothetical protein
MNLMRVAAVTLCLGLGWTTPSQARCPAGLSDGTPPVNAQHIFCGEVRRDGRAVGFHSRPAGLNPPTVTRTEQVRPDPRRPGVYTLMRFRITEHGRSGEKGLSTMFPDHCDTADVIAAIQHAFRTGIREEQSFSGASGPSCMDSAGKPFRIQGFTRRQDGRVVIVTAYPN